MPWMLVLTWVDLRVGGGAGVTAVQSTPSSGRSPRGRRSRRLAFTRCHQVGSISAWAEEPVTHPRAHLLDGVDLRVGGGASRLNIAPDS